MVFYGRFAELRALEASYASGKSELFVVYGRRRVGKTELLRRFCGSKEHVYFTASLVEALDNLKQLTILASKALNDPLLGSVSFQDLEGILNYLADKAKTERLLVIIDEFPYLVAGDKAIPSLVQRFWDEKGKNSKLMLVLCGSSINMMMEHVLAEKAPLYGRRTGQLKVEPFDYRTAGEFFPDWSNDKKLIAYGILGGMPAYLAQFNPKRTLHQNIVESILQKGTFLGEEANLLLQMELRDPKTYTSILRAIAAGNTKLNELKTKVGMDGPKISAYLNNLQELHLIRREVSLTDRAPEKSRSGRYFIEDNFLNFWFRFVEPNLTLVKTDHGDVLFQETIEPFLNDYMGTVFEGICRQYLRHYSSELGLSHPQRLGKVWEKDFDIDVMAENIDGSSVFGECKWSEKPLETSALLTLLRERAKTVSRNSKSSIYLLFSRLEFDEDEAQDSRFVGPKQLYMPNDRLDDAKWFQEPEIIKDLKAWQD